MAIARCHATALALLGIASPVSPGNLVRMAALTLALALALAPVLALALALALTLALTLTLTPNP